jgi:hypothetical protein
VSGFRQVHGGLLTVVTGMLEQPAAVVAQDLAALL